MIDQVNKAVQRKHSRKRVGRGTGSGRGKTCGRGTKGAHSRAGSGGRTLAEGGAKPFYRRLPKRGFSNARHRSLFELVHLADLNRFQDGTTVDPQALHQARLINSPAGPVKILGPGKLARKLTVLAHKFSAQAAQEITRAGGQTQIVSPVNNQGNN